MVDTKVQSGGRRGGGEAGTHAGGGLGEGVRWRDGEVVGKGIPTMHGQILHVRTW